MDRVRLVADVRDAVGVGGGGGHSPVEERLYVGGGALVPVRDPLHDGRTAVGVCVNLLMGHLVTLLVPQQIVNAVLSVSDLSESVVSCVHVRIDNVSGSSFGVICVVSSVSRTVDGSRGSRLAVAKSVESIVMSVLDSWGGDDSSRSVVPNNGCGTGMPTRLIRDSRNGVNVSPGRFVILRSNIVVFGSGG